MSFQAESYIPSTPNYDVVIGKFCYPYPYAPGGAIAVNQAKPRPLVIDNADMTVTVQSGKFKITDTTASDYFFEWAINPGDKIVFDTPNVSGLYSVDSVIDENNILVNGPAVAITSGSFYFPDKPQPVVGTGTNFNKAKKGDYLVVMSDALTPKVQVAKIIEVTDATNMRIEGGFIGAVSGLPFMLCTGKLLGVSVKCLGAGVVNGKAVAQDDVLTFYQATGLEPVYGDSGANTFKILIQK